jgi:hypothetical protein
VAAMTRATASNICASLGVLLLIFAGVAPAEWHAAVALFVGFALLPDWRETAEIIRSHGGVE